MKRAFIETPEGFMVQRLSLGGKNDMSVRIGEEVYAELARGFKVMKVLDLKYQQGKMQLRVTPAAGTGAACWLDATTRLKRDEDNYRPLTTKHPDHMQV